MAEMKTTVLVIDDMEENIDIISAKLKHLGYNIEFALDGESGLKKAQELKPDLILLDIMLPKMDGWQVLEKIRSDERLDKIPCIMMTAYTTIQFQGEREQAMKKGAADYLKKPFDLNDLAALVAQYTRNEIKDEAASPGK
jgi:CheY-like chemotaxis protein